jgi:hypothetical protein
MDAIVVILFYPCCVEVCSHLRRLGAGHLVACGAKKALNLSLVLGVLWRGIIYGQLDHGTDATKLTAGKLAATVAHELPWDAIREDGGLQDFHYLGDRLPLRQPTGDDRAGMVVKDSNQIAIKAVLLAGVEITDIHRPQDMRRQRFKGAPRAWWAWDRWYR